MRSRFIPGRAPRIVAVAAIAALLTSGCGGDRLTKEEFIAAADKICASAEERIQELGRPTELAEIDSYVDDAIALTNETLTKLRELDPPEADEEQLDRMFDAIQDAVDQLPALATAARSQDTAAIADASQKVQTATQTSQEIASQYGFENCGSVAPEGAASN